MPSCNDIILPPPFQADQEVESLLRKLKLLEEDLDNAEDRVAVATKKLQEQEGLNDELIRENKQLHHRVDTLEG